MMDETQGVTLDILLGTMYQIANSMRRMESRLTRIEQQLIFMTNLSNPIIKTARMENHSGQGGPVNNREC